MEIRVLRYFLAIAREENMTRAAERLHISQPSLSKEIKKLEEELGHELFIRTNKNMLLNDEGMLLRKRAEDILAMVDKTAEEFSQLDNIVGGEIRIGCAESHLIKYLARSIKVFKEQYPNFIFHIFSGDTEPVAERLDRGILDLAVIVEPPNLSKYNYLSIPESDKWGLVMQRDTPLAKKEYVTFDDLYGLPLFCSEQSIRVDFPRWCGDAVLTVSPSMLREGMVEDTTKELTIAEWNGFISDVFSKYHIDDWNEEYIKAHKK